MLIRKIARPLLATVFIGQGVEALRRPRQAAQAVRPVLEGLEQLPEPVGANVPSDAENFAKATALVQIAGGVLLASGRLPRVAAATLAVTVVPGRMGAHLFWTEPDPQRRAAQRQDFLTDLSLIGGLAIAAVDTEGKPSLGWRARRTARRAYAAAATALPFSSDDDSMLATVGDKVGAALQTGLDRGRDLAELASEKAGPLLEAGAERGAEFAERAADRGTELAHVAADQGAELAQVAADRAIVLADTARRRARRWYRDVRG